MMKTLFTTLLLFFFTEHSFAQSSTWKLSTSEDGLKIYTRPVASSKFKAIRVECELKATLSQLVAVLMDVDACTDWVYHTKSSRLVKQVSPLDVFYYTEVSVPWPMQNRDFVAHIQISQNPESKVVTMNAPVVSGLVPVNKSVVRIEHSSGRWVIIPMGKERLKIEYELEADPGGDIPAWLTNMFVTEGPLQSFRALRNQIKKPHYQNAKFTQIKDE